MPNRNSAKKRLRQSIEQRARNRAVKATIRTQIKKVRTAIDAGDVSTSQAELRVAAKKLDQAAAKRVIHPNLAARTKSRLSAAIKKIPAATA